MILIIGAAHVIDLRESLTARLREFSPQAVAVELDPDRFATLMERTTHSVGGEPERSRHSPFLLRIWASVQERLASELGELPGSEMVVATGVAKDLGASLFLIDDPMREIAPRLMASLSPRERVKLLISSVFALFIPANVAKRELKAYSEGREEYVTAMREQFPSVARVLLDERNLHMTERLMALSKRFDRVAAVVGDAHVAGLEDLLKGNAEVSIAHLALSPGSQRAES